MKGRARTLFGAVADAGRTSRGSPRVRAGPNSLMIHLTPPCKWKKE